MESVQHVLFQCSAYAHIRDPFMSALLQLVGAGNFNVFRSLSFEDQLVAFLRDDFMSSASAHISAVQRLSDSFLVDVVAFRHFWHLFPTLIDLVFFILAVVVSRCLPSCTHF